MLDIKTIIGVIVRGAVQVVAGYLLKVGFIDQPLSEGALAGVTGTALTVATLVWSFIQKKRAKDTEAQKVALGIIAPPTATVEDINDKFQEIQESKESKISI